ncbi:hypothetical protein AeRB84_015741 [Aphanomyces euteiches]|nr:hypothetical protein AeRB84_015741 [Aphanomyces euteiches]
MRKSVDPSKEILNEQKKRASDAASQRTKGTSTTQSSDQTNRSKVTAASAKRKYTAAQAAAFQPPIKRQKPLPKCVICRQSDSDVKLKCIFCNGAVHYACTHSIAAAVGAGLFPESMVFCSTECYQENGSSELAHPPQPSQPARQIQPVQAPTPTKPIPPLVSPEPSKYTKKAGFYEGEDITAAALKHSGLKAPRPAADTDEFRQRKNVSSPPKIRRKPPILTSPPLERRKLFQTFRSPEVSTPTPQIDVRYTRLQNVEEEEESIEEDSRYHDYFNPPRFVPGKRKPASSVWSQWLVTLVVGVGLLVVSFVLMLIYINSMPYCDSNSSGMELCHSCPQHGICFNGELKSCKEPFLKVENACMEPETVKRDANLMTNLLDRYLMRQASQSLCNSSMLSAMITAVPTAEHVTVKNFDMRAYLQTQAMWNKVNSAAFDAAFTKAVKRIKETHSKLYFTREGDVVLRRDNVSLMCYLQLHVQDFAVEYFIVVFVLFVTLILFLWKQRRQNQFSELKRAIKAVHVAIRQPSNDLIDGAVAHLRHAVGIRSDSLWRQVERAIQSDPRIRERNIIHRGQQVLVWEWVGTRRDDRSIIQGQPVDLIE